MISCWANLPQFPLRKCFKVLQRATRCYKVYQSATKCYTVLECFLWESATRVEKVVLLGRLSHSLNRKYDPWQGTYILLGNDGFRKIQNTAIGSCYQHHSCQRNLKGVFHQDLRAAGFEKKYCFESPKCKINIAQTRPSVNHAKDWLGQLFLIPGLV